MAGEGQQGERSRGPAGPVSTARLPLPESAIVDYIDLTDASQGYTSWQQVPRGKALVSVAIEPTAGQTWSSAIVSMQWALIPTDADHGFAVTYDPAVDFTATTRSRPAVQAFARGWVRQRTTVAESGSDPAAKVVSRFF